MNAVAPGQIYESLPDIAEFDPTFGERYTARSPLKTLVTRKDVATLIANLCTPAYDRITGSHHQDRCWSRDLAVLSELLLDSLGLTFKAAGQCCSEK